VSGNLFDLIWGRRASVYVTPI